MRAHTNPLYSLIFRKFFRQNTNSKTEIAYCMEVDFWYARFQNLVQIIYQPLSKFEWSGLGAAINLTIQKIGLISYKVSKQIEKVKHSFSIST